MTASVSPCQRSSFSARLVEIPFDLKECLVITYRNIRALREQLAETTARYTENEGRRGSAEHEGARKNDHLRNAVRGLTQKAFGRYVRCAQGGTVETRFLEHLR
jgi:hypothetical protein